MSSDAQKWQHRTNNIIFKQRNSASYKIYVESGTFMVREKSETFMVREKYLELLEVDLT